MRRAFVPIVLLVTAVAAGMAVYAVYANEQEYARLIARGDEAATAGEGSQALEAYSGAIALRPDSMLAHLRRGMTYRDRGELDRALTDLRRAAELDPTATRPQELLGDVNMTLQRYDRAAERYAAYLSLDDRSPRVFYKLGLARYRGGRIAAAIDPLEQAVQLDRSLAEAHLLLGLCLREEGRLRPARAALETATRLAPGLTAPREALAAVYRANGENARAIDQLEALAALDAQRPERAVALGLAYADVGRHEAAVLTLSRAVERFPDVSLVYAALGHVWLEAAEKREDEAALRKAIEALSTAARRPDPTSQTLSDLGHALLLSGDLQGAERALKQATAHLPTPPSAYLDMATIAGRRGQAREAREALVRYATLVGDEHPLTRVAIQIADYSTALGDPKTAVRWLDRAIDAAGPSVSLLARLADACLRTGDVGRAREAVADGLAIDSEDERLLALKERVARSR